MRLVLRLFVLLIFVTIASCDLTDPKKDKPKPEGYQEDIPWPSLADSPWPRYRNNAQNSGRTAFVGPTNGMIVNSVNIESINSGIVIGADSSIHFVTSYPGYLYSLNKNGKTNWKLKLTETEIESTPLIGNDGTIYVALFQEKKLFAISPKGNIVWAIPTAGIVQVGISMGLDGTLYFIDLAKNLNAVDKKGKLIWQFYNESFGSVGTRHSAISPDGRTLYLTTSKKLYSIDILSHSINWEFGEVIGSSVFVDTKGNLYCVLKDSNQNSIPYYFYSINSDGSTRWKYQLDNWISYSDHDATMDVNGNIYFASDTLYAFDYNGKIRWKKNFSDEFFPASFICDGIGNIYSVSSSKTNYRKTFYCFDNKGNVIWSLNYLTEGVIYGSPTIGYENHMYVPVDAEQSKILIIK